MHNTSEREQVWLITRTSLNFVLNVFAVLKVKKVVVPVLNELSTMP
jgi:hypothetical protein